MATSNNPEFTPEFTPESTKVNPGGTIENDVEFEKFPDISKQLIEANEPGMFLDSDSFSRLSALDI